MDLAEKLTHYQQRVDSYLDQHLPKERIAPENLHQAMRYSVFTGGKRVRPALVYMAGHALGVTESALDAPAAAVELIHAYSLVHDDLPAMDNDDLRRGQPTCHKKFDEARAILAGDALQTLAFYVLSQQTEQINALKMIEILSLAAGSRGMAGGQAIDMAAVGQSLSITRLENMHIHKTGALIRASVLLGAWTAAKVSHAQLNRLDHYGKCIGLAFQIKDDILDVESSTEALGKRQGADDMRYKPTYPALLGLDAAKQMAQEWVADALASLADFDDKAESLRALARYIIQRDY
jgi:farnesyl diphosphate synthase